LYSPKKYIYLLSEHGKGDQGGKKKKEKGNKEKEAKEPEVVEELDPTEEALAAEPKGKDPFAELPKG
jgi:elongation factor 1-gamma